MTPATPTDLAAQVEDALRTVIDPELGYNIVDLGLIYSVTISDAGVAHIVMTTTTPGCPASSFLREGVRDVAAASPGVQAVDVELTYDPPWAPEMMSPEAQADLGISASERW